jgi:ribosomal protein L5
MEEIEAKTEKKVERMFLNKNPIYEIKTDPKIGNILVNIMSEGAAEFKEKINRPMTYSEMRQMYG